MAINRSDKGSTFFDLGYKAGDSLPFLRDSGVAHRVDSEGLLEWSISDPDTVRVQLETDFLRFQSVQTDQILRKIFRSGLLFSRALMGYPVPEIPESWPIMAFPVFGNPDEVPAIWQKAPFAIQRGVYGHAAKLAEASLRKYLS